MSRVKNKGMACTVTGCAEPATRKLMCAKHYRRTLQHGDPLKTNRYEGATCSIDGCNIAADARGWCAKHYTRWQRHGNPTATTDFFTRTPSERFWGKVTAAPSGCWEWQGHIDRGGYGFFMRNTAHRFAWADMRGDTLGDLHLDHLCRNKSCVNPDHLDPVTPQENTRRARRAAA